MDAIVSVALPQAAALVDLDATYFIQMAMFLVLYVLLTQVFFKPYVRRLHRRDEAGHYRLKPIEVKGRKAKRWVSPQVKYVVGGLCWALVLGYLGWQGRPRRV